MTNAIDLIRLSIREHRTVTEYPETVQEFDAILDALLAEGEDSATVSGAGYSGAEERGWEDVWGTTPSGAEWRVHLVRPPSE